MKRSWDSMCSCSDADTVLIPPEDEDVSRYTTLVSAAILKFQRGVDAALPTEFTRQFHEEAQIKLVSAKEREKVRRDLVLAPSVLELSTPALCQLLKKLDTGINSALIKTLKKNETLMRKSGKFLEHMAEFVCSEYELEMEHHLRKFDLTTDLDPDQRREEALKKHLAYRKDAILIAFQKNLKSFSGNWEGVTESLKEGLTRHQRYFERIISGDISENDRDTPTTFDIEADSLSSSRTDEFELEEAASSKSSGPHTAATTSLVIQERGDFAEMKIKILRESRSPWKLPNSDSHTTTLPRMDLEMKCDSLKATLLDFVFIQTQYADIFKQLMRVVNIAKGTLDLLGDAMAISFQKAFRWSKILELDIKSCFPSELTPDFRINRRRMEIDLVAISVRKEREKFQKILNEFGIKKESEAEQKRWEKEALVELKRQTDSSIETNLLEDESFTQLLMERLGHIWKLESES